jgi:predicted AAA+ superfamily ATPase
MIFGGFMDIEEIYSKKIYKREQFDGIMKWLDDRELILLAGSRQTGKTSLMFGIIQSLIKTRKVEKEDIFFFDAESINDADLLGRGHEEIAAYIGAGRGKKKYVFIDEIHYVKNIDRTLKVLVDHYSGRIKIFASGSSSIEINKRFRESMTGRKIVFEIYPLTFGEYLEFSGNKTLFAAHDGSSLLKFHGKIAEETKRLLQKEFDRYCIFGGYPRVVLEEDMEKKKKILEAIYTAYVRKDVASFFKMEDIEGFNKLVKYAAINSGQILNYESVSRDIGIVRKKTELYLQMLENTYVAARVRPFFGNKTSEIVKMPKVYFFDNGMRNVIINSFKELDERVDSGVVLETAAFRLLVKYAENNRQIKFWRTKTGSEVDFVLDGQKIIAFECKKKSAAFSAGKYRDFMEKYKPSDFYVLNLDRESAEKHFKYKQLFLA